MLSEIFSRLRDFLWILLRQHLKANMPKHFP
jgi:hypothetical protein